MFHTHTAGSECLSSTCGSLRHSGGSSVGGIQRECFHHVAPAVNSAAALPQDCAPLICVRASSAPAPWEFGNFVITNSLFSPLAGGSLGVPTPFENEYSNFSNTVWKTSGLVFLYQLTPSKGPRALPWEAPPVPAAGLKAQRIVRYSSPTLQHFAVKKVP